MAYQVTHQWVHGETPNAAELNKYSDALNAIKAKLTYVAALNMAVGSRVGAAPLYFMHRLRFLYYEGNGQIQSTDGANTIGLSSSGVNGVYDLDGVQWLAYGMHYRVTGVVWAMEDVD